MLTPREFFTSEQMVGVYAQARHPLLHRYWLEELVETFSPVAPTMTTVEGAVGVGKTTYATMVMLRLLYELAECASPQATLGIAGNAPLHVAVISSVRRDALGPIRRALELSPYFEKLGHSARDRDRIKLPQNVNIISGESDASVIGLNLVGLVVDDVNHMMGAGPDSVVSMVRRLWARGRRRPDLVTAIGEIERGRRALTLPRAVIVGVPVPGGGPLRALRKALPGQRELSGLSPWVVNSKMFNPQKFDVLVSREGQHRVFPPGAAVPVPGVDDQLIQVPLDYLPEFQQDTAGAVRDIAGIGVW